MPRVSIDAGHLFYYRLPGARFNAFEKAIDCKCIRLYDMKHLHYALSLALALTMLSCGGDRPDVTPPQYRISWLHSDDTTQIFEYNASGQISEWKYMDNTDRAYASVKSTFSYPAEGNAIDIVSEEISETGTWRFNERLHLDQNGTADRAEGTAILENKNGKRILEKNYTVDFHYNSTRRLIRIDVAETLTGSIGNNTMELSVDLEWTDNNITKYSEYTNPAYPMTTRNYSYFGGQTVHYMPIMEGPILRRFYLPLQYQGVLGNRSVSMLKSKEITSNGTKLPKIEYSYDIATTTYYSIVQRYSEFQDGKENKYTVGWDTK